jgi:hypothetical protein
MTARHRPITPTETVTLDILTNGRDEMNMVEFPLSVLADRAPKGAKTLIFRDGNGTLTVTGSDAFGLPTALDADVIVALIQLTKLKNNFLQPTINFTRYELLRLLGWPNEGKSYRRLDESLHRWVGVSLHYKNCWWDNRSKQYGDANIHIIESVVILDGKSRINGDEQQALPLSSFTWNNVFMESCKAGNLKRLNVETYFSLEHPSSKRLYRFLDKRFYHRPDFVFDLKEIAFERVGLSRNYAPNVGKIKEKLQPAIDELEQRDFLQTMTREERYFKEGNDWKVRFTQKSPAPLSSLATPAALEAMPPLVEELTKRGVGAKSAAELVRRHPVESIHLKLEVFDWLVESQDKRVAKSPEGYLVKSIADGYKTPKGFVSAADRQRQQEAKQARERQEADERRRKREGEASEKRLAEQVKAYIQSRTPEQLTQLEADAIAQASEQTRRNLDDPAMKPFRKTLISGLVKEHIARLLQAEGKTTEPA